MPNGFERFTDRARKVMAFANQEALRLNHREIGGVHILLGLVKEVSGVGANVLKNLDVDLRRVRREVEKLVVVGEKAFLEGKMPFSPEGRSVLKRAIEEARALNHNYVGTEHILLGLFREEFGAAARVLISLGLRLEDVRNGILTYMREDKEEPEEERPSPCVRRFLIATSTARALVFTDVSLVIGSVPKWMAEGDCDAAGIFSGGQDAQEDAGR